MIFENPDYLDLPADYMMTYDYYLWLILVGVSIISSILFILRAKRSNIDIQKGLLLGLGIFAILFGLMRLTFILSIRMPGDGSGEVYDFWTNLGYIFGLGGMIGFLFGIERYIIKKTKFMLTIFSMIVIILGIMSMFGYLERIVVMGFVYVIVLVDAGIMLALYIWLITKTAGIIKIRTILAFFGILLMLLGMMLDSQVGLSILGNLYIAPVISIIGIILIAAVQRYN
ncbi:MAG: hypothetical protein ACTSRZ_11185 [Promethearchaeota archaeon]